MKSFFENEKIFFFCCLLCALPVMLSIYPPMVDIPQHAAQITGLKSKILNQPWSFSELFELQLFTPYWFGYLIVMLLSVPFSMPLAMKIVIGSAQIFFVWTAAKFCVKLGMPKAWAYSFLLLPFGFAYQWGFLNFLVAAPLGFLFLIIVLERREKISIKNSLCLIFFVNLLFVAHLLILIFFCIIAAFLMLNPWEGMKKWILRIWPILTVLPLTIFWIVLSLMLAPETKDHILWSFGLNRVYEFAPGLVSAPAVSWGYFVAVFFLFLPWMYGAAVKRSWVAWLPFILYVIWMMFVPNYIGGNYFTYQRFALFGLPLYFIGFYVVDRAVLLSRYMILSCGTFALSLLVIFVNVINVHSFNLEIKEYQSVVREAEPGRRMVMMAFNNMSKSNSEAPIILHMAGWYQAEHLGLAEFNFSRFWALPLQYKNKSGPGIYSGFEWRPYDFDWERNAGSEIDYFLVHYPQNIEAWIRERTEGRVKLLKREGEWQIYGRSSSRTN